MNVKVQNLARLDNTDYKSFEMGVKDLAKKGSNLIEEINSEYIENKIISWQKEVENLLNEIITPENNDYYKIYENAKGENFGQHIMHVPTNPKAKEKLLTLKIDALNNIKKAIKASELAQSNKPEEVAKNNLKRKVEEKRNMVLKRLYMINDGTYFSFDFLLRNNGFYISEIDTKDFLYYLTEKNYIESKKNKNSEVRITYFGQELVEKSYRINDLKVDFDSSTSG
jgi:predicted transcriptional regulator